MLSSCIKGKMEIITATKLHIPAIIKLWKEFMDFHKDVDPHFPMRKDAHLNWEKYLRELMNSEDAQVLVAQDKGRVIAYSISVITRYAPIWERETYGMINDLAVTSEYRRKGIGQQMLNKIYEWFKSKNIERIELSVAARNQVSNSFWKRQGFQDYSHRLYIDL
jgi:ribosomal protein S18 acetylase RimI-like enzyme